MKKTHLFLMIFCAVAVVGGLGCASLSTLITPAAINERAVDYTNRSGVARPEDFAGYGNLDKAVKLQNAVGAAHQSNQLRLLQSIDKDKLTFNQLTGVTSLNVSRAAAAEKQLFGPEGLLSMGLSMAGFGTLTGLLGLMRKRPSDITPEELKQAVSGTEAQLSDKEKQFAELVKGIQEYIDKSATETSKYNLKGYLKGTQNDDTKAAVAVIKATL